MKEQPTVIDIFCGAGGFSQGFKEAGYSILAGVDNWKPAVDIFSRNHKKSIGLEADMRSLTVGQLKTLVSEAKVNVVIGGPPCQGFSMGGNRNPADPRNSLFREFIRIVKGMAPDFFVMENVRGLLSLKLVDSKMTFGEKILHDFNSIGYRTTIHTLNAANYGVPQKRQRIFFIGVNRRQAEKAILPPVPTHSEHPTNGLKPWVPSKQFLLPPQKVSKRFYYSERMINGFIRRKKKNAERNIGFGWQFLDFSKPSNTISARYWKDGAEALVKYSNKKIRRLTPSECARLQSFPKNYKFCGSEREIYTQVGNAVPPLLARRIAENLLNYF